MTTPNLNLILERWQASLTNKKRDREHTQSNFDELFEQLHVAGATLVETKELLKEAIKAHQPSQSTAKFVWNAIKNDPRNAGITRDEFIEGWHKDIADQATNSMYLFFPIPKDEDIDSEPKVFGDNKISLREYKLQRSHADQFRPIDLKSLEANSAELLSEEELLELVRNRTDE